MLRVAARDLDGASLEDVVEEISRVAEACLEAACRLAVGDHRMAVIGLGKLGGGELNYASDVDLIFVHAEGGTEAQEQAERAAATLIRSLAEPTAEGISLRVDPALRPGGRGGVAVAEPGGDARLLRAPVRHVGAPGDDQGPAGRRRPVDRVGVRRGRGARSSTRRSSASARSTTSGGPRSAWRSTSARRGKELTEVKRGRGGIRDVEFAVQLLQIVHGRRDPTLREPNTLRALAMLAEEGYVAQADADALADAYRFLRRLEHRLQIVHDLQTHDLPADPHARTTLARSLGLADASALQDEYERQTELVRGIHERLFYRPLLEAFAGPVAPSPGVDRPATEELLSGLGFASTSQSFEVLRRLVDPATRMGKVLAHVFPVMVPALALASNPDQALVRLERIAEAVGDRHGPADALAADPARGASVGACGRGERVRHRPPGRRLRSG